MSIQFKRGLNIILTALVTILIGILFKKNSYFWLALSGVLTCYCVRGRSFRQGLHAIVLMLLIVIMVSWVTEWKAIAGNHIIPFIFFALTSLIILSAKFQQNYLSDLLIVSVISLFSALLVSPVELPINGLDIMLGGVIGIICGYVLLPVKLYSEYQSALLPLLRELIRYSKALQIYFDDQMQSEKEELIKQKKQIQSLFISENIYPDWVYEPGFNPGLRSGFRYFLIKLERVIELFYSIDSYLQDEKLELVIYSLSPEINDVLEKNEELIILIINHFSNKVMIDSASNYISDMGDLEKKLQNVVPSHIELLDISPEYISLTGLVRDLKDMRELLIEMLSALPNH